MLLIDNILIFKFKIILLLPYVFFLVKAPDKSAPIAE